jgi:hypothetical protein
VFQAVAGLAQTRLTVLSEITEYVDWLFLEQPPEDEVSWAKAMTPGAAGILASVRKDWANAEWTAEVLRSGPVGSSHRAWPQAGQGASTRPGRRDRPYDRAPTV